jgi:ABC-type glycerol-3-phosphate transport system substrate-binding protein/serine/threonine protein kinase
MIALYRSRRRAEALRAYDTLQARLLEEIGVDPSAPLKDLLRQVLEGDPRLEPTPAGTSRSLEPGLPIRGYELRSQVGKADYGNIYRAYQPSIGREVAVKVIRPELANDPGFIRRFESDLGLIATIESTSLVPLYDFWREPDGAFLVEKLVSGGDLRGVVARGRRTPADVLAIVDDLALPIERAHDLGLVHGDIRLEKLLLDGEGQVYLTDFGISSNHGAGRATDIIGLAACAAQLLAGRLGSVAEVAAELDPEIASVLLDAGDHESVVSFVDALRVAAGFAPSSVEPLTRPTNPYKGLEPFEEVDASAFFGRQRLIERMIARMGGKRSPAHFLAVVGPSGGGKSSVVRAGLIPALRSGAIPGSDGWYITVMTPGSRPFESLARALAQVAVAAPPTLLEQLQIRAEGLREIVDEILPDDGSPLLLVVDQFEELYTLAREDERQAFIDSLVDAATHPRSRLRVVVTLRADFYDHPLASRELAELLRDHTELVTPMSASEIELAVTGPAQSVGVVVEPALLVSLTADTLSQPGALPMLQYTLTELYERHTAATMSAASYREMGGLTGALVDRAEALFAALTPQAQVVTQEVFLRLVSVNEMGDDTRRRVLLSELMDLGGADGEVDEMLRAFARHRLLSLDRDPTSRAPTVEIAHESLLGAWGRFAGWIDAARDDIRAQRRLAMAAEEWAGQDENPDFLLSGASLARYATWGEDPPVRLTPREQTFLEAAFTHEDARQRTARTQVERESKLRIRTRVLIGLVALSVCVVALAFFNIRQASESQAVGAAQDLVFQSSLVLNDDPTLAIMLAIEAIRITEGTGEAIPEAMDALHWAIQESTVDYPVDETSVPVAVRPYASGPRGVFAMEPTDLVKLGLTAVGGRRFDPAECQRYFDEGPCPDPVRPVDGDLTIRGGHEAYVGLANAGDLAGTAVTITSGGALDNQPTDDEFAALSRKLGFEVENRTPREGQIPEDAAFSDDHGDIVVVGAPGAIGAIASERPLINLGAYLSEEELTEAFGPHLMELSSWEGEILGVPLSSGPGGLIWYNAEIFTERGYTEPSSWDELIALSDRMVQNGHAPWCLGLFSGPVTGWPATNWLETVILSSEGPELYDQWVTHQIPFDHPAVVAALEKVGQLAHTPGYTLPRLIEETSWDEAMLYSSTGQCMLYFGPNFGPTFFEGTVMTPMRFPAIDPAYADAVQGSIFIAIALSDRPEVRQVMRAFTSPTWGSTMTEEPEGWFSPAHRDFNLDLFTDPIRRFVSTVTVEAQRAGMFRFDASDLMPFEIGFDALNPALTEYLSDPSVSAEDVLSDVEAAWVDLEREEIEG